MRVDHIELGFAARRERARAIATLLASAFAWLFTRLSRDSYKPHAARPHFAR